ncbi:hypothetical protein ACP43V_09265 [Vibrio genomosp. F10 str. 9ZC157]|uniref:Formyl transferase N-terminal domain-containing protein n=1 Tax=Vibrio genomosp. F10 str. ZF-129 TaxID=1187848 RepID=A0A1E5BDD9_9VIBR|nr:hypothetical protein [Vibrio genomosp. F10]OEE33125.1 hypothetical protein A1QO_10615 [Vibrio genomosp. F10 str. ZF-129]OEE95626.1 hypothetical protein A1QM_04615 [Vibrio genomosp. F10 str. 9ZC157]
MNMHCSPLDVYYIGSSELGLQALAESDSFEILKVLCLKSRVTKELISLANKLGYEVILFEWHKDFRKCILQLDESVPFFIYQLDMLVPEELTLKYSFYNVHRGCLRTNRGPNPDVWPILLGHGESSISLHKINGKIDSGTYIDSFGISINPMDDSVTVKEKLERYLPKIIKSLSDFLKGTIKGTTLTGGKYYPWVTEEDFTINTRQDCIELINRKIKCQKQYFGAILIVSDYKYYVTNVMELSLNSMNKYRDGFSVLDNEVIWCSKKTLLKFTINNTAVYKPMIKRQLPIDRI